jgi:hypothetical protein
MPSRRVGDTSTVVPLRPDERWCRQRQDVGQNGADTMRVTPNHNVSGGNGADTLYGGGGNDTLAGGANKDWMGSQAGTDQCSGAPGLGNGDVAVGCELAGCNRQATTRRRPGNPPSRWSSSGEE